MSKEKVAIALAMLEAQRGEEYNKKLREVRSFERKLDDLNRELVKRREELAGTPREVGSLPVIDAVSRMLFVDCPNTAEYADIDHVKGTALEQKIPYFTCVRRIHNTDVFVLHIGSDFTSEAVSILRELGYFVIFSDKGRVLFRHKYLADERVDS